MEEALFIYTAKERHHLQKSGAFLIVANVWITGASEEVQSDQILFPTIFVIIVDIHVFLFGNTKISPGFI